MQLMSETWVSINTTLLPRVAASSFSFSSFGGNARRIATKNIECRVVEHSDKTIERAFADPGRRAHEYSDAAFDMLAGEFAVTGDDYSFINHTRRKY